MPDPRVLRWEGRRKFLSTGDHYASYFELLLLLWLTSMSHLYPLRGRCPDVDCLVCACVRWVGGLEDCGAFVLHRFLPWQLWLQLFALNCRLWYSPHNLLHLCVFVYMHTRVYVCVVCLHTALTHFRVILAKWL